MLGPLDMFSIGIGSSSSHTVGPMKAGVSFAKELLSDTSFKKAVTRVSVDLYGSLALTGDGHGTFLAVVNGLAGELPATIDPDTFSTRVELIKVQKKIGLLGDVEVNFDYATDLRIHKEEFLPLHANGMRFSAYNQTDELISSKEYYSIGGGFIMTREELESSTNNVHNEIKIPYPFNNATELFSLCKQHGLTVAELSLANELAQYSTADIYARALEIAEVMHQSVHNGLERGGNLPGGLNVRRRAPGLYQKIVKKDLTQLSTQDKRLLAMVYAISVNEENASFNKIVTAPTNGAAGTIPGALEYYRQFVAGANEGKIIEFLLTAGAIGMLYKKCASISAAEVGCQGEIGVACSMASGALTAVLGGSLIQVEKAAEIAMEHSLGMTCDPVAGLVQIPCIERNGIAASRAIDIAELSLLEEEPGKVSLDAVIKTMLATGRDMSLQYKETALGGLAVNVVNC